MSTALRFLILLALLLESAAAQAQSPPIARVVIDSKPIRTILPDEAIGMGIDGSDHGTTDRLLNPDALRALHSLGVSNITYRLRTELAIEAWHWNPVGTWSDAAHQQGYFTGADSGEPIRRGWGYRLPRRGSTIDQANNDGYSRLTDGDPATYWKSNPYLDAHFTGDPEAAHPQWFVVDLGEPTPVNAVRIQWAAPYATRYRVDYCDVPRDAEAAAEFSDTFLPESVWKPFPRGAVNDGQSGDRTIRLRDAPRKVRYVRVMLLASSHTALPGSTDPRDHMGYAVREVGIGRIDATGRFVDAVIRGRKRGVQTAVLCSSTDPWHSASDRDADTEQPGFDAFSAADLNRGRPILFPVGVLYDTPENAAALLRYLRLRHIPVKGIELGEEPDGQDISPEDYGALYIQFARALHAVDPAVPLGGPSLQTSTDGWIHWPDASGDRAWMRRFVRYLSAHHARNDFAFFSFEWYPFDDMRPGPQTQLRQQPGILDESIARLKAEGVPATIPWYVSELGWSAFSTVNEVDLPGAVMDADIVGQFLRQQRGSAYFYGVEPGGLINEKDDSLGTSWGGLLAFLMDEEHVKATLPVAWTMRLLTGEWAQRCAGEQPHTIYRAIVRSGHADTPLPTIGAYALRRPDRQWALLLVNRDGKRTQTVRLPTDGTALVYQYGPKQYAWHADGEHGHPIRSLSPERFTVRKTVTLPPFSLTVLRWGNSGSPQ